MMTLDTFLESIDYLPPVPRNLSRLIDLLNRCDIDVGQVVELIEYDPALTAQVMRLCNSASFAGGSPASDLREATARLGFNEIFQLVVALSTASLMRPQQKGYGIEAGELWQHCVASGIVGKVLAMDREENVSLVFTGCLLHDIGKTVLSRAMESKYSEVISQTKRTQCPMLLVERELLGFDHAEVGSRLLERWGFPPELVSAVRFHHDPARSPGHGRLAAFACLANMIACFMGYGCGYEALAMTGRAEALELAGLDSEDIPRRMTQAFYVLRDTQALLSFMG